MLGSVVTYPHCISRGGEWASKKHRSRKRFVEFQGSCSLVYSAALCVSQSQNTDLFVFCLNDSVSQL